MTCDRSQHVHQYHDGELPAGERDALEAHIRACPDCQDLLNDLRGMSRMLMATPMVAVTDDAMQRLRDARFVLPDTGVLKIAGWLTAAAAAVLLAALPVWPPQTPRVVPAVASADTLDTVAVNPPSDPEGGRNDLVALAQWMSDDLSGSERH